jgi:hypothetical protein
MTLLDWNKKLSSHFEALANQRSAAQRRVFVLEHGLSPDEVNELQRDVRAAAASRKSESKVALPWIVYATEVGYRFSGDEYWQTFEAETPGFEFGERNWIREQFLWFHRKFQGIRPTGPWAQHRSIICWPIANAVLPRDLQRQLARILFEMRYVLNADLFSNPEKLGQKIADRSWDASNRLQDLCQEPLLIGQIGAALLLEGQTAAASLILPATLRRIATDLNREQQAREWLKTARGVAVERAKVRGLAPVRSGQVHPAPEKVAEEVRKVLPEPTLILRPGATPGIWNVNLQLPNMMPLVEIVPQARAVLTESRCEVAGASGRPLARGRLLQGVQRIPLTKWPKSGQPLLKFERSDPHLELIVRLCIVMPGPGPWLFRVASDGIAYVLKSTAVRTGQTYLLLGGDAGTSNLPSVKEIAVACEGINGIMLQVPTELEQSYIDALKSVGVAVAPTIRVWPAGTAALEWDGEGRSEWLATEEPTFAIRAETAISSLIGKVNASQFDLGAITAGATVFIGCPELQPGRHEVALFAKYGPFVQELPLGKLDIYIRPPRAGARGTGTQGPLLVDVEPFNPTLEHLREGRVQLTIRGPKGRELDVATRMFQGGNDTAIFSKRLPKLPLPILPESWNRYIQKNLLEVADAADSYDLAKLCDIEFSGAELGTVTLRFEREGAPVRWVIRKASGRKRQFTVISEAIEADPVEMERRTFENPDMERSKEHIEPNLWTDMPHEGGLFIARVGRFTAAIVLAPEVHGLRDLKASISVRPQPRSLQTVLTTLGSINLWASARLSGSFLSGTRQRDVIRALALQLHEILCGVTWTRIEASIDEYAPDKVLKFFVAKPQELAIAKAIMEELPALLELPPKERAEWLWEKLRRPYNLVRIHRAQQARDGTQKWTTVGEDSPLDPKWVVEFALRLASDPAQARAWGEDPMRLALEKLLAVPAILRMARLMVVVVDKQSTASHQDIGRLYAGWNW